MQMIVLMTRFGMEDFDPANAKEVEEIQQEAGNACMYESFMEVKISLYVVTTIRPTPASVFAHCAMQHQCSVIYKLFSFH